MYGIKRVAQGYFQNLTIRASNNFGMQERLEPECDARQGDGKPAPGSWKLEYHRAPWWGGERLCPIHRIAKFHLQPVSSLVSYRSALLNSEDLKSKYY